MDDPTLAPHTPTPAPEPPSRSSRRRLARAARVRTATTMSAAILTERGLAEGYVALPLSRLMAQRVWTSVETLNQQLTLLERVSFARMTSDPQFEAQGKSVRQLLEAYVALTLEVATLAQRLAQHRLTEADCRLLTTGHLTGLLSPDPPGPAARTEAPREGQDDPEAPTRALPPVANGITSAVL